MIKITACGSAKNRDLIHQICSGLEKNGFIVLPPPLHEILRYTNQLDDEGKLLIWKGATFAHFNRIKSTDVCLIINPDGYIGSSTTLELGYAVALGKLIISLNKDNSELARECLFDIILHSQEVGTVVKKITGILRNPISGK